MEQFYKRMQTILKDEYDDFIKSLDKKEVKGLFLNKHKYEPNLLDKKFIKKHPLVKNGYIYDDTHYKPGSMPYFLTGNYYIQEPSAMLVSNFIDIKEDDYVLDMCAAPGGKSCGILNKLSQNGLLITNDINSKRSKILSENIERFGAKNAIVTNTDPINFEGKLNGYFDKIILDAPCSGEGMLRKTTLAKETWSVDKVNECAQIQKRLIECAYKLLKKGGQLMYSTCTYSIEENEDIVNYALSHFDFKLEKLPLSNGLSSGINMEGVIRCYPHKYEGEGQFLALLTKTTETNTSKVKVQKTNISKNNKDILNTFYKDNLNIKMPTQLIENNNHIYSIQKHFPVLENIKILRNGLYLGECKKNRFIPSYSLALTLKKEDVKRYYDFNALSKEAKDYIHGEALNLKNEKGFGVIFIDNQSLSFYKESNQVKNLFPKGLRR